MKNAWYFFGKVITKAQIIFRKDYQASPVLHFPHEKKLKTLLIPRFLFHWYLIEYFIFMWSLGNFFRKPIDHESKNEYQNSDGLSGKDYNNLLFFSSSFPWTVSLLNHLQHGPHAFLIRFFLDQYLNPRYLSVKDHQNQITFPLKVFNTWLIILNNLRVLNSVRFSNEQ